MPIPRAVLDTNVVISSLWGGNPGRVIDLWEESRFLLLLSFPVLKEYLSVLGRFGFTDEELKEISLSFLSSPSSLLVHPSRHFSVIVEDPSDNFLLDCAVEGKADVIVSGDQHLLKLKIFRGIPILSPLEFLRRHMDLG